MSSIQARKLLDFETDKPTETQIISTQNRTTVSESGNPGWVDIRLPIGKKGENPDR